jgi:hypothetical protein
MAFAGVNYTVGREAAAEFGESAAGRLPISIPGPWKCGCDWSAGAAIDGRGADGKPLPLIQATAASLPPPGSADKKVQAYNFRLCMTQDTQNFRPVPPPTRYDPAQWELLRRVLLQNSSKSWHFSSFIGATVELHSMCALVRRGRLAGAGPWQGARILATTRPTATTTVGSARTWWGARGPGQMPATRSGCGCSRPTRNTP